MSADQLYPVPVEEFAGKMGFELVFRGREKVNVKTVSLCRPGLQLAGFFNFYDPDRMVVIGLAEYEYLRSFSVEERKKRLSDLFSHGEIPAIILCRDLPVMPELVEVVHEKKTPVFRSSKRTSVTINELTTYLNRLLAPTTSVHATLVEVFGVGVLLTGRNGIGKSETAMELVRRGHRLVADDNVVVKNIQNGLIGTAPDTIRYFLEIRGIGIINVQGMYGSGSVLNEKSVDLVIELDEWSDSKEYDRLGVDGKFEEILGKKVEKYIIPVRPGRNLAIIIEVAARNLLLKRMGYDATQELIGRTTGR